MANLGNRTRRQQVLERLAQARGEWVNGTELATEAVGGSEGLRRVRELIEEGYQVESRRHPDSRRDIWQYRLVTGPAVDPRRSEFAAAVVQGETGYVYVEKTPRMPEPELINEPPPPEYQFTRLPAKIDFGAVAICPRCHARSRKYTFQGLEGLRHKDPYQPKKPCLGCNGFGIVPNKGPIAMAPSD